MHNCSIPHVYAINRAVHIKDPGFKQVKQVALSLATSLLRVSVRIKIALILPT
jgi:hypothetical protein